MTTIVRFEEIEAWQTARKITRMVYDLTRRGEFARDFGLCDQMRRTCVSIMSNIAEGFESSQLFELCDKCSRQIASFMQYLARQLKSIREEGIAYDV